MSNSKLLQVARAGAMAWTLATVAGSAAAENGETPRYGGALNIGSVYVTLSALSWDPYDWNWKVNHDTGFYFEQLIAGDLSKSRKNGGKHRFVADASLPSDGLRGELAESWEWEANPLALVFKLRRGIMWPEKPGVMKTREFVADDVVFSFNRLNTSPRKQADYFDFVDRVEARDRHTVVFHMKAFNAEWGARFGWGYNSAIVPKELVDAGPSNWKNATGTGPFQIAEFVQGGFQTYVKNPDYWDKERIGNTDYRLPFVDKVTYRTIKDTATQLTALRSGKLDILESVGWRSVDELKKSAPTLLWSKRLSTLGQYVALRVDSKPFDDIRVRRALNMAVNKDEIVAAYYGGNAEMLGFPMYTDWTGYYQPLAEMPPSVKQLFTYDPQKAKELLKDAGYPNGFTTKMQFCTCSPAHGDLAPMIAAYLEKIGVRIELQPMEYGAFLSAMTTRKNAPMYLMNKGHTNPTMTIRTNFVTGQLWNPSQWSDAAFDRKMADVYATRDEAERQRMLREMTVHMLDQAPYIWLPTAYLYAAWWPWVKNYDGELSVGAVRPGPIYARIWIDQELKRKMGF
ncbi:ABC transporter substrate-binding protein [Vineibacter terrae]|uniref:ABC transporter substrate-binding protein n=2 Tax=Vineibacter terrae TaxID=2586908 RepID=A0A5C8PQK2_9HYPH|nr:ABC transporter substrate-binding protein [Vineibacter terrae]